MADESLEGINRQLKETELQAKAAADKIKELEAALTSLISKYAKGGTPTETGISRFQQRFEQTGDVPYRGRVGGGAYLSGSREARESIIPLLQELRELRGRGSELSRAFAELRTKIELFSAAQEIDKQVPAELTQKTTIVPNKKFQEEEAKKAAIAEAARLDRIEKLRLSQREIGQATGNRVTDIGAAARTQQQRIIEKAERELAKAIEARAKAAEKAAQEEQNAEKIRQEARRQEEASFKAREAAQRAKAQEYVDTQAAKDAARTQKDYERIQREIDKENKRIAAAAKRQADAAEKAAKKAEEFANEQANRFQSIQQKNPQLYSRAAKLGFTPDKEGFQTQTTVEASTGIKRTVLQYRDLDGAIQKLTVTQNRHNKILSDSQKRFRDLGSAIARDIGEVFKWSIAVAAVYAPLQKLQELTTLMIDNESKLADIAVILSGSHEQMGEIFNQAAQAAAATGESINGVLEGYTLAYRATGRYTSEIERNRVAQKLLIDSLVLSKLSALDQAQAMDTLVGALQQLGYDLDQGAELVNKWVAVSKVANVGVDTLAESFAITSTSATNAGLNIDELNGIIAVVAENTTLSATEAGNAVRAFISGFQTDNARDELDKFGIAMVDASGTARSFIDVMTQISDLYQAGVISDAQLNRIGESIGGGARRGAQVVATIRNLGRASDIAAASAIAQNDAYDALGIKLETLQSRFTLLGNSFQELAQNLGDDGGVLSILKLIVSVADQAVKILSSVTKSAGGIAPLLFGGTAAYLYGRSTGFLNKQNQNNAYGKGFDFLSQNSSIFQGAVRGGLTPEKFTTILTGTFTRGLTSILATLPQLLVLNQRRLQGEDVSKQFAGAGLGGLAGALITGLNPVGAAIGATIGTTFVDTIVGYETQFSDFFANVFDASTKKPTEGKTPLEIEQEALTSEIYKAVGGGSEDVGKALAFLTATVTDAATYLSSLRGEGVPTKVTPALAALALTKAPFGKDTVYEDFLRRLQELDEKGRDVGPLEDTKGEPKTPFAALVVKEQQKNAEIISRLVDEQRNKLRELAISQSITSKEYNEGLDQLSSGGLDVIQVFTAMNDVVGKTEIELEALSDVLFNATEDQRDYIIQLTTELADLENRINTPSRLRKGESEADLISRQREIQQQLDDYVQGVYGQQQLNKLQIPAVLYFDKELTQRELDIVIQLAKQIQDRELKIAAQEGGVDESVIDQWKQDIEPWFVYLEDQYERITGVTKDAFQRALDVATETGQVSTTTTPFNVTTIDANRDQFLAAYQKAASFIRSAFPDYEFQDKDAQGVIFKENVTDILHLDNLVTQLALQELIDVNKKQLDGLYNLPSGADFFVPIQTLQYAYNAGLNASGGGGGVGDYAGTGASSNLQSKTLTSRDRELKDLLTGLNQQAKNTNDHLRQLSQRERLYTRDSKDISELKSITGKTYDKAETTTNLKLDVTSTTQLMLDGRLVANVVKAYLWEELIQLAGAASSINRSLIIP